MKSLYTFIFVFSFTFSFAQNKQIQYEEVAENFQKNFNNHNYNAIYNLFDEFLKVLLPQKQTVEFLNNIQSNWGSIQKIEFTDIKNSAYVFRTTFDSTLSDISFTINNENQISAFFIPRNKFENSSILTRNSTKMIFPFKEEAFVYWGGETLALNYHMADINQQYAYDILMVANGAPFEGDPTKNESYFVFGKDIMAPCDAQVVKIIDNIQDNIPGEFNKNQLTGNAIVLETSRKEYLLFGHLKYKSILVQEGDIVHQGQVIAQCGNSGNSTQAHLHLQIQNTVDLFNSIGAKLYFDDIIVNGELKRDYLPVKEDFVKNNTGFSK